VPITYYPDHAQRALARVLAQYRDASAPGVKDVVGALAGEVQAVEDALWTTLGLLPNVSVVNLAPFDGSFDSDSNGDGLADGWRVYNNSAALEPSTISRVADGPYGYAQRIAWAVPNTTTKGFFTQLVAAGGPTGGGVNAPVGWVPLQTYVVAFPARASGTSVGQTMALQWNQNPATTTFLSNPPLTTDWQLYVVKITFGASTDESFPIGTNPADAGTLWLTIAPGSGTTGTLDIGAVLVTPGATQYDFPRVGAALDLVGKIIGEPRSGDVDLAYLPRLQARIRINRSSGSIDDLISVFQALEPTATIKERGDYPAAFALQLSGLRITRAASYAPLLRAARKAGVRSVLEYATADDAGSFVTEPVAGFSPNGIDVGDTRVLIASADRIQAISGADVHFEKDSNADGMADGWFVYNNSPGTEPTTSSLVAGRSGNAQRLSWSVNNTSQKGICLLATGVGAWQPFKTYVAEFFARASGTNTGKVMQQGTWNAFPVSETWIADPALSASFQRYIRAFTWGAAVEPSGSFFQSIFSASGSQGTLDFDDFYIKCVDTDPLAFPATGGSIVIDKGTTQEETLTYTAFDGAIFTLASAATKLHAAGAAVALVGSSGSGFGDTTNASTGGAFAGAKE
jgi:hypothetical protein